MALDDSFLLIESDWPCERAYRLLSGLSARWAVVHRVHQGEPLYYAFQTSLLLAPLRNNPTRPVGETLNLRESDASPTRAADTGPTNRTSVVVSGGLVSGVLKSRSSVGTFRGAESFDPTNAEKSFESTQAREVSRAVKASAPPQVALGQEVRLVVELSESLAEPGTVPIVAEVGEALDVEVQISGGLELKGSSGGELKITEAGAPALLFKVVGRALGPGEAKVLVFQRSQCVGRIPVSIRVVQQVTEATPEVATTRIEAVPQPPDLQLLVFERRTGADVSYEMRLSAADPALGLNFSVFGPISLQQEPRTFFKDFYGDIETILTSAASPQQKLQRLGAKGDYLFSTLVPPAAREHLWKLRSRIQSVHIQSEEPWIPWELIKLSGDDGNGGVAEGEFLCGQFEVTRWIVGLPYQRDLSLNDIGTVTPADSGLPAAQAERKMVLGMASPQRRVTEIEPEEVALRKALSAGTFDAFHFTGHGVATAASADRAEIRLEQGSRLRPEDLTGVVANLRRKRPLIFLNACEIGRAGMGLTGPGGWPRGFLSAGAGAFIGPFWKVLDATAASFAAGFYQALMGGASVGRAALEARSQIRAASDPTWLAYSVYAYHDARLVSAPGPST